MYNSSKLLFIALLIITILSPIKSDRQLQDQYDQWNIPADDDQWTIPANDTYTITSYNQSQYDDQLILNDPTNTTNTTNTTTNSDTPTPSMPVYNGDIQLLQMPSWMDQSSTQLTTFLDDHYNFYVTPKGNRVWAGALSLAWEQLQRSLINGQNATFSNLDTEIRQKLIDNLNSGLFTKSQLSQESYYVKAGFGQQTVDLINKEVNQKFPKRTFDNISLELTDDQFISYAYVFKQMHYPVHFEDEPNFYFNNVKVAGFKSTNSKQRKQVYYKYYNDRDDFMMGIQTTNPNEQILLIKNPSIQFNHFRFQKIIKMVGMYENLQNQKLQRLDQFKMPNLNFDFSRQISEMMGLSFTNPEISGSYISGVLQRLKLKMDKEGVTMENDARIILYMSWGVYPKYFILDSDFWLILKQKNKMPYCIMMITNPSEQWSN